MSNPLLHIRIPQDGIEILREARFQAIREGMTLGEWLIAKIPILLDQIDQGVSKPGDKFDSAYKE